MSELTVTGRAAPGTADAWKLPLDKIDVSRSELYGADAQGPYFARLRRDDPVHYCPQSATGPYWSITRFHDIKFVDTHHDVFSSEVGGISIAEQDAEPEVMLENFIAMDPPRHDQQRKTVAPSVAPANLANLEPLIRERVVDILEHLPIGRDVQLGGQRFHRADRAHAGNALRLSLRGAAQARVLVRRDHGVAADHGRGGAAGGQNGPRSSPSASPRSPSCGGNGPPRSPARI